MGAGLGGAGPSPELQVQVGAAGAAGGAAEAGAARLQEGSLRALALPRSLQEDPALQCPWQHRATNTQWQEPGGTEGLAKYETW